MNTISEKTLDKISEMLSDIEGDGAEEYDAVDDAIGCEAMALYLEEKWGPGMGLLVTSLRGHATRLREGEFDAD